MMEKPLAWFIIINLVLLFISGCWTIGSLIFVQSQRPESFVRITVLIADTLANGFFLISILINIFGLTEIIKEEMARKIAAYTFAIGIISLIISITISLCIIAIRSPWVYD